MNEKLAIIGGGASGLVAGIEALKNGFDVSIFDKNDKFGRKILATGNGRCNVTNKNLDICRFHGEDKSFIEEVLKRFDFKKCKDFFEKMGINLTILENGKAFPLSLQASTISEGLFYEFKRLGGKAFQNAFIEEISKKGEKFIVNTQKFDKLLIATGSNAMKKLGSTSSGYEFARKFSHEINPTFPSLVQLITKEDTSLASGVKFRGEIEIFVNKNSFKSAIGDLLFTKYGISGSAVLDVSRIASEAIKSMQKVEVRLDCLENVSIQKLKNMMTSSLSKKPLSLWLNGFINKKLALLILKKLKINPKKESNLLNKKEINSLIFHIKNLSFQITDTKGFEYAEVSAGGVSLKDINPKTLESKKTKNLYFSGEVLDVDGDCGGFNLHWAWASGFVVGSYMR